MFTTIPCKMEKHESGDEGSLEVLSKKSCEVVLPLFPSPIARPKRVDLHLNLNSEEDAYEFEDAEEDDLSDQDERGRPRCNPWKGENHELHVLGQFENEFQKNLKSFQIPDIIPLKMDPYCRTDVDHLGQDVVEDAFIIWERPEIHDIMKKDTKTDFKNVDIDDDDEEEKSVGGSDTEAKISEDEIDERASSYEDPSSESETELEIADYIQSQNLIRDAGGNVTGETLWYDPEFDEIRNLHKGSISMRKYGGPADERIFGKTAILFDQLSPKEQQMLRACERDIAMSKVNRLGNDNVVDGTGDFSLMKEKA